MSFTNSISSNMDMRRTTSFLTSQSMGTKDICILVVHDDPMYCNIILEMLQNCSHYEVMKFKRTADALNIIQEKKERLNIVITDVHRSHSNGFEVLNYIEKEFKLPVISMTPHQKARVVPLGLDNDARLYFVKSLSVNEFKTIWQHAYTKERGKPTGFQRVSVAQEKETGTSLESETPIREVTSEDQNHKKRKFEETDEQSEGDNDDSPNEKKQRVMWNESMHHKFLKAVQLLGYDRAFPKKILEIMNVPGLTRENVASHLQKYRMCLKRAQEEMQSTSSNFGIHTTPLQCFQSSQSDFISSETNRIKYQTQKPLFTSYQPRVSPINISNFSYPETSTSTSNFGQQQFFVTGNQESPRAPYAHNSCLSQKTQSNTCPVNINMSFSNFYSNHPKTSTNTSILGQQKSVTVNNQEGLIFPYTHNSPLTATTQFHSSPLANENPEPDSLNNTSYAGFKLMGNGELVECGQTSTQNSNANTKNKTNFLNEGNENESVVQFPLTEVDNNSEQRFYVPPAECEIEDLLEETGEIISPEIIFDLDDSLLEHI